MIRAFREKGPLSFYKCPWLLTYQTRLLLCVVFFLSVLTVDFYGCSGPVLEAAYRGAREADSVD